MTKRKQSKTVEMCNDCICNTEDKREEIYVNLMHCLKLRWQKELQQELQNHVSSNDVHTVVNEITPELHEDHPVVQHNNFRNRQCNYFLLPIGQRCNIDGYIIDHTPYFDVGECNW